MESQVSALLKERNEVPDETEDQERESHHEPSSPSPEPPPSPPPSPVPTHYAVMQNLPQEQDQLSVQYSSNQQPIDQSANMDLSKPIVSDRANGVSPVIDNNTIENSQQTSNCVLYIAHNLVAIRIILCLKFYIFPITQLKLMTLIGYF